MVASYKRIGEAIKQNKQIQLYKGSLQQILIDLSSHLQYTAVEKAVELVKDNHYQISQFLFDFPIINQSHIYHQSQ